MHNEIMIEKIIREVLASMGAKTTGGQVADNDNRKAKVGAEDYPLAAKRPEWVKTPTNKTLDDITLQAVLSGDVKPADVRIAPETLEMQAQIAESVGRDAFARNLRRAAELVLIPDERILEIYNALRPYRSTKQELLQIADELENKYNAKINGRFVREAAEVYEIRDRLRNNNIHARGGKSMKLVAGVDIGNDTTETAVAKIDNNNIEFISEGIVKTTGIKGTKQNIYGVLASIKQALDKVKYSVENLDIIRINEAAPVIGDIAMETITETIITESTMIGHNPSTPGGMGLGTGITVHIDDHRKVEKENSYIVLIPASIDFSLASELINSAFDRGINIVGAIAQKDDGVLISNRINKVIPIVDEVALLEMVPVGMRAAIEVAPVGGVIGLLSNPYGIATLFELTPEETKLIVPIARALIGNRSAVVIKTPKGDVQERVIPAGKINIIGKEKRQSVNIDDGADMIMSAIEMCTPIEDINGEPGSNAGGMLERVRQVMANLTGQHPNLIKIQDLLATDTFVPQKVKGGLAGEFSMENAVGIAAMVKADRLQMQMIAGELQKQLNINVEVGGVEADMAIRGAMTTPGSNLPLAIIDMGAGSIDASFMSKDKGIRSVHLAGAGNMVTLLINTELGLEDIDLAEDIKKYRLAKVESLFHIRHEDGTVQFFEAPLDPKVFAKVIVLKDGEMVPVPGNNSLEKIKIVRREAKNKVFVTNTIRALNTVSPTGNIRDIEYVVLVGGSALDFEVPQFVTDELSRYGVVAGRANIRGSQGPRNAVATGLVLAYKEEVELL
jgi:diol dehydratase reactivase alpha subunit